MSARWLVTGGAGFIGARFVARLRERGDRVAIASPNATGPDAIRADIFDEDEMDEALRIARPTHLALVAWTTEHRTFWNDPANVRWQEANQRLVDRFLTAGGEAVLGVGTCAEYAWNGEPLDERAPLQPDTPYGVAKAALGASVAKSCAAAGARSAWGRIFFVYGPGEGDVKLATALVRASEDGVPFAAAEPDRRVDLIYVDDAAEALATIAASGAGAYNIGSGTGTSVRELATLAGVAIAAPAEPVPLRPDVVADIAHLRGLGWSPSTPLARGLDAVRAARLAR